jgi:cytochrome c oxidase assembly protein Cox11
MGDGNTVNDIVIVDSFHFKLRGERQEVSMGRIYKITYIATDSSANSVSGSTTVIVPVNWPVS